jgi:DNA-binding Xre family transcriptional regulator
MIRLTAINKEQTKMMSIEQIRQALADRRLSVVAQATGISYGTLYGIREGKNDNPGVKTMERLGAYLEGTCNAIR